MNTPITTAPTRKPRRYGQWAGNTTGSAENPTDCVEEVSDGGRGIYVSKQCSRKRGYGANGLYCRQHAKRHPA